METAPHSVCVWTGVMITCDAAGRIWWTWHRTHPYSLGKTPRYSRSRQAGGRHHPYRRHSGRQRPSRLTTQSMGERTTCPAMTPPSHSPERHRKSPADITYCVLCTQSCLAIVVISSDLRKALINAAAVGKDVIVCRPSSAQSASQPGIWGAAVAAMTGNRPPQPSPPPTPPPAAAQPENLEVSVFWPHVYVHFD